MGLHVSVPNRDGKNECAVCGGVDKSLPEDCPGRLLTIEEKAKITEHFLDYKRGKWQTYAHMDWYGTGNSLESRSSAALKGPGALPDSSRIERP
jgi:hypothetical protein